MVYGRCSVKCNALAFAEVADKAARFAVGQTVKVRGFPGSAKYPQRNWCCI